MDSILVMCRHLLASLAVTLAQRGPGTRDDVLSHPRSGSTTDIRETERARDMSFMQVIE